MDSFNQQPAQQPPSHLPPTQQVPNQTPPGRTPRPAGKTAQPQYKTKRTRADRRSAQERVKEEARYKRWGSNRLAIPYSTDGPKVTLGIAWFTALILVPFGVAILNYEDLVNPIVVLVLAVVSGLAALQIANTWFGATNESRSIAGVSAAILTASGLFGVPAIGAGLIAGFVLAGIGASIAGTESRAFGKSYELMLRSIIPVGLAGASMTALATTDYETGPGFPVLVALVILVSAYEAGDFLIGSGADNAFEGPMAGIISLVVVAFGIFLFPPSAMPGDFITIFLFAALTAICCPLGQMLASALIPNSTSWAPALRRLDSYLLSAPIWVGLAFALGL